MAYKKVLGLYENEYDIISEFRQMYVRVTRDGDKRTIRISDDESGIELTASYIEEGDSIHATDQDRTHR